jgi:hypothetical protein
MSRIHDALRYSVSLPPTQRSFFIPLTYLPTQDILVIASEISGIQIFLAMIPGFVYSAPAYSASLPATLCPSLIKMYLFNPLMIPTVYYYCPMFHPSISAESCEDLYTL